MISKDESIVSQVAAKIASDIAIGTSGGDLATALSNFSTAYSYVDTALMEKHGFTNTPQAAPTYATVEAQVAQAFPGTQSFTEADMGYVRGQQPTPQPQYATAGGVRIKGTQHGPIPDWLFGEAAKAGVQEVWDNRDGLAANPKRPWFKSTSGGQDAPAFWPPKGN